jgi:hypothetical protein
MSKQRWDFKVTSVRRAIKTIKEAGLPVSAVTISRDGDIVVDTSAPPQPTKDTDEWKVA